jgi:tRNA threonylcarbamoyladenosine biosynthesis protein TsaE
MKKIIFTSTTEETELAGKEFAASLSLGDFVAMRGDLGVGKTAFIRGMAQHLAPRARVQSPTYQIVNEYRGGKIPFYHFDMYRIDDEDSLTSTGYFDYI